jgi:hypothetical protein
MHRWATVGCKGVVLQTVSVGGTKCTSPALLCEFFAAIGGHKPAACAPARTGRQRSRDIERAERECRRRGA